MAFPIPYLHMDFGPHQLEVSGRPSTLTLTLEVPALPWPLTGGDPVERSKWTAASPATAYVNLAHLLSEAQCEALSIDAGEWNWARFGTELAFCPKQTTKFSGTQTFTMGNAFASGEVPMLMVKPAFCAFTGPEEWAVMVSVEGTSAPAPFACQLLDHVVRTTQDSEDLVENELFLALSNSSQWPLVSFAKEPRFVLSFPCAEAPGWGALTTAKRGGEAKVEVAEQYRSQWKVEQHSDGAAPYWVLKRASAGNQFLGAGTEGNVELVISKLVTELPAEAPDPTQLDVQLLEIQGYVPNQVSVPVMKVAGPQIEYFYADPGTAPFAGGAGAAALHWSSANVDTVGFDAPQLQGQVFGAAGATPRPVPIEAGERIAMTAAAGSGVGEVAVERAIEPQRAGRTSVALTQLQNAAGLVVPNETTAFVFEQYLDGVEKQLTKVAMVERATGKVAYLDLAKASGIGALGNPLWTMATCASSDRTTIFALVRTDAPKLVLVAIEVASGLAEAKLDLGDPGGALLYGLQPSGTRLHCSAVVPSFYGGGGLTVIDSEFKAPKTYPWSTTGLSESEEAELRSAVANGVTIGPAVDDGMAYVAGLGGLAVLEVETSLKPLSWICVAEQLHGEYSLLGAQPAVASADGRYVYCVASRGPGVASESQLLCLEVSAGKLSLAETIAIPGGVPPALALDASGGHLYLSGEDRLLRFDTEHATLQELGCGSDGDYLADRIAVDPVEPTVVCSTHATTLTTVSFSGL